MTGAQVFSYQAPEIENPHLRIGLSTGWCIWTYGTFDVKILPLTIDIVDPISDDGLTAFVENGYVVNAPEFLSTNSNLRDGVAADGATQVALRHEVLGPGQVQFVVDDPNGGPSAADDVGFFSSLGGTEQQTTLTVDVVPVTDGRYLAYAVYHAPADFVTAPQYVGQGCRKIRVQATYLPAAEPNLGGTTLATRDIEIVRPPVVLQHGLWSDPSTWGGTFLTGENFEIVLSDCSQTNDRAFWVNREVTKTAVRIAVHKLRTQNYAATRADIVGHSMGGVLARLYAQSFGGITYKRNDNFNKGDIHKLLTIDSPLKGSPLATFLMQSPPFRRAFEVLGNNCRNGAVRDLDPYQVPPANNPNTWSNTQPTEVYAHAIIGSGGATVYANPGAAFGSGQYLLAQVIKHYEIGDAFLGGHDIIVETSSQEGNVVKSTTFPYLDASNPALHGTIHQEDRVRTKVLDLLNTNILDTTAFALTIPARILGGVPPVPPEHPKVDGMSMTFPTSGAVFSSGGQIPVTVAPINGFQPESILVLSPYDVQEIDPLLLQTTLSIPANAVGPMPIYVAAFDADSNLAETDDVVVQIVPPANLTGISIAPTSIELTGLGPTQALTVTGHYDDEIDRDLTSSVLGTSYQVADRNVATVSADGLVTSVGVGQTIVTAGHGSFTAPAQVEVIGLPLPGDLNADGILDELDRGVLCVWMLGALEGESGYDPAADFNSDGVIDHLDQELFNQILPPCIGDVVTSATFQPPPDGIVDAADLSFLLGAWDSGVSCADFVSSATFAPPPDGIVDGADLAALLAAWGPCGEMLLGGGGSDMMNESEFGDRTSPGPAGTPFAGTYLGVLLEELIATNDSELAELIASLLEEMQDE
jgi:pimeloyl-ACP methyl ester carboxylesterase